MEWEEKYLVNSIIFIWSKRMYHIGAFVADQISEMHESRLHLSKGNINMVEATHT